MKPIIILAGAAAAGGVLWYMRENGLGPWAPSESNLDESIAAGGGFTSGQLSDSDRPLLGLGPRIAPSKPAATGTYTSGIAAYMSSWQPRGVAVPADKTAAIPQGGRSIENVSCGTELERTSSGIPYSNIRDPSSEAAGIPDVITTPNGGRYKIRPVRGFVLNADELAIYAPDAGRLWGLTEGVLANNPAVRVDLFVTAHGRQKIDRNGNLLGSGVVFAWHPTERRWLQPNEWRVTALPSRKIRDRRYFGDPSNNDLDVYGYKDTSCRRTSLGNIKYYGRISRTKAVPV
jgi:hypothetical protein